MTKEKKSVTTDHDLDSSADRQTQKKAEADKDNTIRYKTIRDVFIRFSDVTSIQGIQFIARARRVFSKTAWTFLFLAAVCGWLYHSHLLIKNFYAHGVTTIVGVTHDTLPFPSVTVCNTNPLRRSAIDSKAPQAFRDFVTNLEPSTDFPQRRRRKKRASPATPTTTGTKNFGTGALSAESEELETFREHMGGLSVSLREELGHQKNTSIVQCIYNGRVCDKENFTTSLTADYGNCFTFNSFHSNANDKLWSAHSGRAYGLTLTMYVEYDEYLHGYTEDHGMRVAIHPYATMPFVAENGMSVNSGQASYIGMRASTVTHLGSPYPNCTSPDSYVPLYNYEYTIQTCINTCLDRTIAEKCGCYRPEYYDYYPENVRKNLSKCSTDTEESCEDDLNIQFAAGLLDCHCQPSCKYTYYNLLMSGNKWPDPGAWYDVVGDLCDVSKESCQKLIDQSAAEGDTITARRQILADNFVRLRVFYHELNYETIDDNPDYPASQYYSDIGGAVGLWIGASVFTLAEMLDLMVQLCYHCSYRRRKQRRAKRKRAQLATDPEENGHKIKNAKTQAEGSNKLRSVNGIGEKDVKLSQSGDFSFTPNFKSIDNTQPLGQRQHLNGPQLGLSAPQNHVPPMSMSSSRTNLNDVIPRSNLNLNHVTPHNMYQLRDDNQNAGNGNLRQILNIRGTADREKEVVSPYLDAAVQSQVEYVPRYTVTVPRYAVTVPGQSNSSSIDAS